MFFSKINWKNILRLFSFKKDNDTLFGIELQPGMIIKSDVSGESDCLYIFINNEGDMEALDWFSGKPICKCDKRFFKFFRHHTVAIYPDAHSAIHFTNALYLRS